jgi:hypothetical protein
MRRIVIGSAIILFTDLLVSCGGPRLSLEGGSRPLHARPSHFGITLPYPKKVPPYAGDSLPPVAGAEFLLPLHLLVDAKGRVKTVAAESAGDSAFAKGATRFFRSIKFVPGLRNGKRDSITVRVLLQVGGGGAGPLVRFPVGPDFQVDDSELYWAAFAELGYRTACLRRFESYYFLLDPDKTWREYEYQVFRVDLDSTGDVVAVELNTATTRSFIDQIKSAINWGEYEPMTIHGRPVASSNFLVVLFLPTIAYPTLPVDFSKMDSSSVWDRLRVHLFPDTLGVMAPPIPKQDWSSKISEKFFSGMIPDLISGRIQVDTAGISGIDNLSNEYWKARRILVKSSLEKLSFPALDFSGKPRPWRGLVYLKYLDDSNVQVWFDWDLLRGSSYPCELTDTD